MKRTLLICCSVLWLAGCGGNAPTTSPAPSGKPEREQVTSVYGTTSGSSAAMWIAGKKGFFRKHGLNVNVQYAESNAATAALLSGEAQFAQSDAPTAFATYLSGGSIKVIGVLNKNNSYSIVVRPEIQAPADLKGKRLAVARPGDTSDISARIALKPHGLQLGTDIIELSVGNSAPRLAALLSCSVDAAVLSEAFVDEAVAQGMRVLISLEREKIPYMATAVQVTESFAKANPNTAIAYLKGLIESVKFYADEANKTEVFGILAENLKSRPDDPAVASNYRFYHDRLAHDIYPNKDGADTALEALKGMDPARYGSLSSDVIIEGSFAEAIRASGFQKTIWGE